MTEVFKTDIYEADTFRSARRRQRNTGGMHRRTLLSCPYFNRGYAPRRNQQKTPLGLRAKALIDDGNLVPDEIINEMVLSRIQHEDCSIGFLLDGYPRTIAQAETLAGAVNIDAVIDINVDSDILIERVSSRRVCPKCNHSQCVSAADTAAGKPELCAKCGAELIRRPDDNPESMRHRLEVYYDRTFPLINFYREKGLLVPIDGAMSIGDVSNRIFAALDPIFEKNKKLKSNGRNASTGAAAYFRKSTLRSSGEKNE